MKKLVPLWSLALAAVLALAGASSPAMAQDKPTTCRMGAYVTSVHDVKPEDGTFKAVFWMWSVCPEVTDQPLMTLEFPNGQDVSGELEDKQERTTGWWSARKFAGTFRNDFELGNFPFDRQNLTIDVEEGIEDERQLLYTADAEESGYSERINVQGWKLGKLSLKSGITTYGTTFGDPSLADGSSRYASLAISIPAERAHWVTFIQATLGLYIVALLVIASLFIGVVRESMFFGRMGVLGAALVAVLSGVTSSGGLIGARQGMHLLDHLNLALLGLIAASAVWTIMARHRIAGGGVQADIQRHDRIVSIVFVLAFVLANVALLVVAQT